MTISIATVITMAKDYNPELTTADDARILRWINAERDYLLSFTDSRSTSDYTMTAATADITANDQFIELPDDFVAMPDDGLQILDDDGVYQIATKLERSDIRAYDAQEKTYADNEFYYALRHRHLIVRPTPGANKTDGIRLDYYKHEDLWGSGDNLPNEWNRFREILALGAGMRSGIRYEDNRAELERQYVRLFNAFRQNFSRRDLTPARMTSIRSQRRAPTNRMGRIS